MGNIYHFSIEQEETQGDSTLLEHKRLCSKDLLVRAAEDFNAIIVSGLIKSSMDIRETKMAVRLMISEATTQHISLSPLLTLTQI